VVLATPPFWLDIAVILVLKMLLLSWLDR